MIFLSYLFPHIKISCKELHPFFFFFSFSVAEHNFWMNEGLGDWEGRRVSGVKLSLGKGEENAFP